jgi:hypothetical protein
MAKELGFLLAKKKITPHVQEGTCIGVRDGL